MIRLFEDIEAVKRYYPDMDDNTFMTLIALDPTYREGSNSVGKFGKWILNLAKRGEITDEIYGDVTSLLQQFITYRNRFENKDINAYKTIADLASAIDAVIDDDSMLTDRQRLRFLKNVKAGRVVIAAEDNYDTLYDSPQFIMWSPNTHEASMKLGKGTRWCTAHEEPRWYEHYTANNGKLYIILDKETGRRYQYSDAKGDLLDDNDRGFDWFPIFSKDNRFYRELSRRFPRKFPYVEMDGDWCITASLNGLNDNIVNQIKKVQIPAGTTVIPEKAFYSSSVEEVIIPDTVETIGDHAFAKCRIKEIDIPESVETIGTGAFSGCGRLSVVHLPDKDISFGNDVFDNTGIKDVSSIIKGTNTGSGMFQNCKYLVSVDIPEGVRIINQRSFAHTSITSATIPDTVTLIGDLAFGKCEKLKKVNIPDSVIGIKSGAFTGTAITSITIPSSVTNLGNGVFYNCASLKKAVVSGYSDGDDGRKSIPLDMFEGCGNLQSCTLDADLDDIKPRAFHMCKKLESIVLPDSVKEVGRAAFKSCRSLTELRLPLHIEVIGQEAFARCINIKTLDLGESLTEIGEEAFNNCVGLTSVRIPSTIREIQALAFAGCSNLRDIYINSNDVTIASQAFAECSPQLVVHTSSRAIKEYCRKNKIKVAPFKESFDRRLSIQE